MPEQFALVILDALYENCLPFVYGLTWASGANFGVFRKVYSWLSNSIRFLLAGPRALAGDV
jgi:hypothetical protein